MSAEILVTYKAEASSLEAVVSKIGEINNVVVKGAQETAKKVGDSMKEAANSTRAAFSGEQVKAALNELQKSTDKYVAALKTLEKEEVVLIATGQKVSNAYKDNQKEQAALRSKIAETTATQNKLTKEFGNTEVKAKSLKTQIRENKLELQRLEAAGLDATDQFRQLLLVTARLEDQAGDLNETVRVLASDTFKFDVAVDAAQQLAGAFAIGQGAAALFGDENQDLQKVIAKTTAAMSILQGVQQLGKFFTGQSSAAVAINTALQQINAASVRQSAVSYTILGTSVQFSAKSLNIFKGALAATGVGLLVIGIGLLIEKLEKQRQKTEEAAAVTKNATIVQLQSAATLRGLSKESIDLENKLAVLRGDKSQADVDRENIRAAAEVKKKEDTKAEYLSQVQLERTNKELTQSVYELKLEQGLQGVEARTLSQDQIDKKEKEIRVNENLLAASIKTVKGIRDAIDKNAGKDVQIIDIEEQKAKNEKAIADAEKATAAITKQIDERFKITQNTLRKEEILNGASLQNKIKQAENQLDIDKNNAKGSIKNAKLRLSTIELLEAESSKRIEQLKLDEVIRVSSIELEKIKVKQSLAPQSLLIDQQVADSEYKLAKENAEKIKTDNDAYNLALLKADADYQIKSKEIAQKGQSNILSLKEKEIQLTIAVNGKSLENEKLLIEQRALIRKTDVENSKADALQKAADIKLIEAETLEAVRVLESQYRQKALEGEKLKLETKKYVGKAGLKDQEDLLKTSAKLEQEAITERLGKTQEAADQIAAIEERLQKDLYDMRVKAVFDALNQTSELFSAYNDVIKQDSEQQIARITETRDLQIAAIQDSTRSEVEKQREIEAVTTRTNRMIAAEKLKQAKLDKAVALFNAVINTAAGITKAIPNPVLVAAAILTGAAQIAAITSQPLPKFAKGGLIGGRSHSDGGTMIEAEKGEYIINKKQYAKHPNEVNALNQSTETFRRLINERYVKPVIMSYIKDNTQKTGISVNATLDSKTMENELRGLRKDMKKSKPTFSYSINDNRYQWHRN